MHGFVSRLLSVAVVSAAAGIAAAPAQAFTPPIGSDKGSVTGSAPAGERPASVSVTSVSPVAGQPAADGIIAILIG